MSDMRKVVQLEIQRWCQKSLWEGHLYVHKYLVITVLYISGLHKSFHKSHLIPTDPWVGNDYCPHFTDREMEWVMSGLSCSLTVSQEMAAVGTQIVSLLAHWFSSDVSGYKGHVFHKLRPLLGNCFLESEGWCQRVADRYQVFTYIWSHHPNSFVATFYRRGNWGVERLSNLFKVILPVGGRLVVLKQGHVPLTCLGAFLYPDAGTCYSSLCFLLCSGMWWGSLFSSLYIQT